jgi:SAM-dependent methyltransferase
VTTRSAAELQADYYARTSHRYDEMHVAEGDEHYEALEHISSFVASLGLASLLDVGSGTGRALAYLRAQHSELRLVGVEPVQELAELASKQPGITEADLVAGSGERLPFEDGSFDAVAEFAVLHHVADPGRVVAEMIRVARRAVFLSDDNRFGHGPYLLRILKLGLYRAGLWGAADLLRNRGRPFRITEDDGLFYSYSVYDSYAQLAAWADRIILIPTRPPTGRSWLHPLLTTTHLLLCAIRDER